MRSVRAGQALVEMAMVLVIFLMMMVGIGEFGRLLLVKQAMLNAAREGARFASVTKNLKTNDSRVRTQVEGWLKAAGINPSGTLIAVRPPVGRSNARVTVTVSQNFQPLGAATREWAKGKPILPPFAVQGVVTMRYESSGTT